MWALYTVIGGKGKLLGSGWTSEDDELEAFFSLYKGPNELIWRTKSPINYVADILTIDSTVRFACFRRGVGTPVKGNEVDTIINMIAVHDPSLMIDIDMAVVSKNWHQGRRRSDDAMEIKFIPNSKSILKNNTNRFSFGGDKYKTTFYLYEIFKEIVKGTNNKSFRINSSASANNIKYKNFTSFSNPIDTIDKIAIDNQLEYFYGDNILYIGTMITDNNKGQKVSPSKYFNSNQYVNTIFTSKIKFNGKLVTIKSGGYPDTLPLPGTQIHLLSSPQRVIYLNLQFGKKIGSHSVFISIDNISVPKDFYYKLLPEKALKKIFMEYQYDYPNIIYGNIEKYIGEKNETIRRNVNTSLSYATHDPENMIFPSRKKTPIMFESTPYAGEEVGLQFPKNTNAKIIALAPDGKFESGTIVGQIFQNNKMPKRDDIFDYRLTLGGAATQYYDYSVKTRWDVTKIRNVIGVSDSITFDKVPLIGDLSSYIQLGKAGTEGAEYAYLKTANNSILLTDSKVTVNGGSKLVARKEDPTLINSTTDTALITWFSVINTWAIAVAAVLNGLGVPAPYTQTPPTTLTGKINGGNAKFLCD